MNALLAELHTLIAELARRSPTFRVLAPGVVALLARIETEAKKETR